MVRAAMRGAGVEGGRSERRGRQVSLYDNERMARVLRNGTAASVKVVVVKAEEERALVLKRTIARV
jgi:hypothetical protein